MQDFVPNRPCPIRFHCKMITSVNWRNFITANLRIARSRRDNNSRSTGTSTSDVSAIFLVIILCKSENGIHRPRSHSKFIEIGFAQQDGTFSFQFSIDGCIVGRTEVLQYPIQWNIHESQPYDIIEGKKYFAT